ncbi:PAS domain-containing protein [Methanoregula sp.]|jgi:PAS domain S-box-containing protein|uniref:PAS domain-containing protein n=1 Tax=Methanoregula sp. TaxID=2052170 RepID=UPI0025F19D27|nr:PAS domain-containing protein [Methanoregula sp.]
MGLISCDKREMLRFFIVAIASISAILGTIFSLTHGISSVFQFLYILPIICVIYFYPRRAVLFALAISIIYICLVYVLGAFDPILVAISTAWFAIFITLAVVTSSYANGLLEEKARIRYIIENTRDGIFCFDPGTQRILGVNQKCAQWLLYSREDLDGGPVSTVWTDADAQQRFREEVKVRKTGVMFESLFRQKSGGTLRCIISPLYVTKDTVLCSVANVADAKVADEEIRQTLEDLERQVRERTVYLEQVNDELRAEIIERRSLERTLLSGEVRAIPGSKGEN